jgi:hypothetical protein
MQPQRRALRSPREAERSSVCTLHFMSEAGCLLTVGSSHPQDLNGVQYNSLHIIYCAYSIVLLLWAEPPGLRNTNVEECYTVALVRTDFSEERSASIIRMTIGELGTNWLRASNVSY